MRQRWFLGEEYLAMGKEIDELQEEIARTWRRLASPRVQQERQRSGNLPTDYIGDGVARAADMERVLAEKIETLCRLRAEAEEVIAALPTRERRLLRLRYFHGRSWQEIAFKLHYDESTCRRLHRQLLRDVLNRQGSAD